MNCEEFRTCLDNYETLTEFQKSEMESHANECEKCQAELDFFLSMLETMRTLPKIEPPADFMDNLNIRLDREDRKAAPLRAVRHIRRSWRQYTALAACFALVAVITANRGILFDRIEGTEDGVITEETTKTGDNAAQTAKPASAVTPAPKAPETPQSDVLQPALPPSVEAAATNAPKQSWTRTTTDPKKTTNSVSTSKTRNVTTRSTSVPAVSNQSASQPLSQAAASVNTTPAAVSQPAAEPLPSIDVSVNTQPQTVQTVAPSQSSKTSSNAKDYSIALAGNTQTETAQANSSENEQSDAEQIRASYSIAEREDNLAMGQYYKIDKDGNPIDEGNEPKAIGSLSIASADAERAMEVIRQYPHGESGNMYTTDQTNFSLMLSMLSTEGISYTNYTPAGSGEVKFMVVFN